MTPPRLPEPPFAAFDLQAHIGTPQTQGPLDQPSGRVSRRGFVQASGAVGLGLGAPLPALAAAPLEAYAKATSVKQGGTLEFCVRDPGGSLTADTDATVTIVRVAGWVDLTMLTTALKVRNRSVPLDAATAGCNWPTSYTLPVPAHWRSGLYYAFFVAGTGTGCCVPFVVRAAVKSAAAKVMVQVPVTTAQALNNYGGRRLVGQYVYGNDYSLPLVDKVSFDRPLGRWNHGFDAWQPTLARWLEKTGVQADFCTNIDLHREPGLLNGYALLVIAGQDSFWTRELRTAFDSFVNAGGNAALLAAHTARFHARLAPNAAGVADRTLVCYQSAGQDPETRDAHRTPTWDNGLAGYEPEQLSVGLCATGGPNPAPANSATGAYCTGSFWVDPGPRPATPYQVKVNHWMFAGSGLALGSSFGADLCGYVTDAAAAEPAEGKWVRFAPEAPTTPIYLDNRPLAATFSGYYGGPSTLTVLAVASARHWRPTVANGLVWGSVGHMAIFCRGGVAGTVFNAGTTDYVFGLKPELDGLPATPISRITRNLVSRLSAPHRESAEVRRYRLKDTDDSRHELVIGDAVTMNRRPYVWGPDPLTYAKVVVPESGFRAFAVATGDTVPVYRHKAIVYTPSANAVRFVYSLNSHVGNGWAADGIAFHAYASARPNTVPVYRHHRVINQGWYFYYSTRVSEPGWIFDDLAFYAPTV